MLRIVPVLYKYFNIMILPRSFIRTEIIVVYFIITEYIIFVSTKESSAFPIRKYIYHKYMSLTYIYYCFSIYTSMYVYIWFLIQYMYVCEVRLTTICTIHISNVHVSNKYIYISIYLYIKFNYYMYVLYI